jgi:hypothetical protein
MTTKKVEIQIRQDMRDFGFFQTHNFIVDDYLPLIAPVGQNLCASASLREYQIFDILRLMWVVGD